jgi:predicted Fe-Mo cluster-binding NifX family protein
MKVAITSTGPTLESPMDPRFGRAAYILIADAEGNLLEAIDNSENINAMRGAGIQAAKTISDKGASTLLTGHCGPNAVKTLSAAGISIGVDQEGTPKEALERLAKGEVQFTDQPNVEGHW